MKKFLVLFLSVSTVFFAGCGSSGSGGGGNGGGNGRIDRALVGTWKIDLDNNQEFWLAFNVNETGRFCERVNGIAYCQNFEWYIDGENLCIDYSDGPECENYFVSNNNLTSPLLGNWVLRKTNEPFPR